MKCRECGKPTSNPVCTDCTELFVTNALQAVANGIRPATVTDKLGVKTYPEFEKQMEMANKPKPRYWLGEVDDCQVCGRLIGSTFVDGALHSGPWACMCKRCHKQYGRGLGVGRGQEYTRQADGRWLKTDG